MIKSRVQKLFLLHPVIAPAWTLMIHCEDHIAARILGSGSLCRPLCGSLHSTTRHSPSYSSSSLSYSSSTYTYINITLFFQIKMLSIFEKRFAPFQSVSSEKDLQPFCLRRCKTIMSVKLQILCHEQAWCLHSYSLLLGFGHCFCSKSYFDTTSRTCSMLSQIKQHDEIDLRGHENRTSSRFAHINSLVSTWNFLKICSHELPSVNLFHYISVQ